MLEKIEDRRRRQRQRVRCYIASPSQWTEIWANFKRQWRMGSLACCSPWGHRVGHSLATEQQQQLHAVRNLPLLIINISYLQRVSISAKQLKILFYVPVDGNEDLAPSQQCCFSLVLHPLPSLINNCLYLPPWNSGKVMETERLCAQESHQAFLGITMGETRCQYVIALQYLIRICVRDSSTRT